MSSTLQGYLVLADISGYTSFIAGTELEHSQAIVGEILHLVVDQLTPTLELAEIEGDAVFAYVPAYRMARKETLLELIETTYLRFRNRRDSITSLTTCTCRACAEIPTLDLKFIAHAGTFMVQTIAGKQKPVGSDVILAHRLLKNTLAASKGWRAYVLLTESLREELGLAPETLYCSVEHYEYFGSVPAYSFNLHERYEVLRATRRTVLTREQIHGECIMDFAAPPAVVWDWLCSPEKRTLLSKGQERWSGGQRPGGRSGVGASNHCDHGSGSSTELIVDWKPFEYFAAEYTGMPVPIIITNELTPIEGGTRLVWQICFKTNLPRWLCKPLGAIINKLFIRMDTTLLRMQAMIEAELRAAPASVHTSAP
jgi:hypothetical protein